MDPAATRKLVTLFGSLAAFGLLWALMSGGSGSGDPCVRRCVDGDGPCLAALQLEGIAPAASDSPSDRRGICNGVCSALRRADADAVQQARIEGFPEPSPHACRRAE